LGNVNNYWQNLILQTKSIAPIGAASFFVIAMSEWFNKLLHFVRNDEKDIADSGIKLPKKIPQKDAEFIF
jgi:hypothetical protein